MARAKGFDRELIENLVRQSQFIFRGTIRELNAATMPDVPITEGTAIVNVSAVFTAPPQLGDYSGRDITIQLRPARDAKAGLEAAFFTSSWMYGDSLAVLEVGHIRGGQDNDELRRLIADVELGLSDRKLEDRIAQAELVILGRVVNTAPQMEYRQTMPITEHDPDWWEATILVESLEQGKPGRESITVLYPNSMDEMWIDSPKFPEGQYGIWILQRDQQEKGWSNMRLAGYTALDPLDFQPASQVDRIRALVKRSQ